MPAFGSFSVSADGHAVRVVRVERPVSTMGLPNLDTRTWGGLLMRGDGMDELTGDPTDSRWFRRILGQYPTGVCVVTATEADGRRAGFVVGSFTSASLNPPLVAF